MRNLLTTGLEVNFDRLDQLPYPYLACIRSKHNKSYIIVLSSEKAIEKDSIEEAKEYIFGNQSFSEINIDKDLFIEWENCIL